MERTFIALAGLLGALAVALGAYGAHGLARVLADVADAEKKIGWWQTAAQYHLAHAIAILGCAWLVARAASKTAPTIAGFAFVLGIVLFSGTLYAMALGAPRVLGAVTPLGGLSLIVGWLAVAWAAFARA